uniref:AlgX/AlgJ SGNH hydrolase-like domain-containing protein n=1 Tax=Rubrivivax gelatinosus S1 TaxID=1138313 RepID=L8BAR4_RUBGE|nr:hypothetical protein RGS1_10405 [Rubrivivax gelatinosus S1]
MTGALATLLALELLLRLLPVSTATLTGYYLDPEVLSYPPGHAWRTATGWDLRNAQTLRANNWGFVADHDFVPDPEAVGLIGDSYVEASMLAAEARPATQLERLLRDRRPVYAFGSPGTALLDHAQRVRLAAARLGLRDFVFLLEDSDARQSLCGSGNVQSRCLDPDTLQPRVERLPPPSALKRVLRHSALAQYLGSQLKFRGGAFWDGLWTRRVPGERPASAVPATPSPAQQARSRSVVDAVVSRFFADAGPYLTGRAVFLVDGDRHGRPAEGYRERDYLIERLRAHGAEVIDLETVYSEHARHSALSLDVGPYDRHLNGLGVELAMRSAAGRLR